MPKEYEEIKASLIRAGRSLGTAKRIAAATYNKRHPNNPNPWRNEMKRKSKKKKKSY